MPAPDVSPVETDCWLPPSPHAAAATAALSTAVAINRFNMEITLIGRNFTAVSVL
jgi:hypothetical protein